jgi:hypothetical protein
MSNLWEYNPDLDTIKSFKAFCVFRDLGPARSIEAAYRIYNENKARTKQAPGHFKLWAANNNWDARAAAFDGENDRINLEKHRQNNAAEHDLEIENVRKTIHATAMNHLISSSITASLIRGSIERIQARSRHTDEQNNKYYELSPKDAGLLATLVNCKNKDAATIALALDQADQAIGIRQLQERLAEG